MKKLLFLFIVLTSYLGYSQGGPLVDVIRFQGKVTTTIRNAIDVPIGQVYFLWNTTTGQFEYAGGDDIWLTLADLSASDINTYAELNAIVADVTLTHNGLIDTSAELAGILTDETGSAGGFVRATSPTLVTPALGTPSALVLTNATGLVSAGIVDGTIDETDLDASTNVSLDLADTSVQPGDIDTFSELDAIVADKSLANLNDSQVFAGQTSFNGGVQFQVEAGFSNVAGYGAFGVTTGNIWYMTKNGATPFLSFNINALTASRELIFSDADITYNGASLLGGGIAGTIAGRTGTNVSALMIQTQAQHDSDGAPAGGEVVIISDATPAKVVTTATIAMDGWKMYDDQTADAATITLSDCHPGETLTVYINRASAPSLAGTGLTFNQLPNTTAFAGATEMGIYFEVSYNGTTIDYYYFER